MLTRCSRCGRERKLNENGLCYDCKLDKILRNPVTVCTNLKTSSRDLTKKNMRAIFEKVMGASLKEKLEVPIRKYTKKRA